MSTTQAETGFVEPKHASNIQSTASLEDGQGSGPTEHMRIEEPLESATVFTTPNVMDVKGKMMSANFAIFIAGMNDAAVGHKLI